MWRRHFSPDGFPSRSAQQAPVPVIQQRMPFGERIAVFVGEVVSSAGEGVHGSNVQAHPGRHQAGCHGEVLVVRRREASARRIGLGERHYHSTSDTPARAFARRARTNSRSDRRFTYASRSGCDGAVAERHDAALGATADRARDVQRRACRSAAGQDEPAERLKFRFGLIDPRLEPADVVSAERRLAHAAGDTCVRIGQPRPEGEQIVLQLDELRA